MNMKIIDWGTSYHKDNFWDPIFGDIEMEDAVIDEGSPECIVIQVGGQEWQSNGYWFVSVVYCVKEETKNNFIDHMRHCDLMFNNRAEAMKVKEGYVFDKNEQEIT